VKKQVSKTMIGSFVVGAIALVVVGVLVFGSGKFFSKTSRFVMYFEGSLKGLNIGAPVTFRGVPIGSVTGIQVRIKPGQLAFIIPVFIEINTESFQPYGDRRTDLSEQEALGILIGNGLRAQMGLQSLITGQLMVEIDFFPDSPITLQGYDPEYLEIPTIPTTIEALAKKLEEFPIDETLEKLANSIDGLERLTTSEDLHASITDLSASIKSLRNMMQTMESKAGPVLAQIEHAVTSTNKMVGNIDNRTATLTSGVDATLNEAQGLIRNIDKAVVPIASGVTDTTTAATATLEQAERSMAVLEAFIDGDTVLSYNMNQTFVELADAVRNLRALTDYLERHPEALLRGKSKPGGK